jgi:hypothetical protein
MPNSFRSGSNTTLTGSIFKGPFTIGINPSKVTGPTVANTGFYPGIIPLTGSTTQTQQYAIYAVKSTQGPSIRVGVYGVGGFNQTNDLQSIAIQYGATGSVTGSGNLPGLVKWFDDRGFVVINFDYEDIVTDGLIGLYDAAYTPSYPMSGSTVYDLSGKGANGTINGAIQYYVDAPTLSDNSSRAHWDFGKSTTYTTASFISTAVSQSYMDFTIVFQPTFNKPTASNSGVMAVFATSTPAGNQDKSFRFVISGSGLSPTSSALTIVGRNPGDINDWAWPSASTLYINGVSGSTLYWTPAQSGSPATIPYYCIGMGRTNTTGGAFSGSFPIFIGSSGFAAENRNYQGTIALALFYNRVLSAAEQQQNYNALKGRFRM